MMFNFEIDPASHVGARGRVFPVVIAPPVQRGRSDRGDGDKSARTDFQRRKLILFDEPIKRCAAEAARLRRFLDRQGATVLFYNC